MATANNEFFEALAALEKERGLPEDYLVEKIKAAIVIAVKKDYEVEDDNVVVDIDPEIGAFRASLLRDIVEEVENPHTQVSLEDAQKVRKSYKVGQRMVTPLKTKEFGRIAAQTATGSPKISRRTTTKRRPRKETSVIRIPNQEAILSGACEKLMMPSMA